ncbi:uncharacterized protein K02A2.6-like [Ostrinia furnacalis]|uniref:uncharacterized protein K02A2.6-like n=1 Tax=Ostrinia furnacalis TaxID=93504 RepID=UPI00103FC7AE|nr:uncharacterized protein K02A2.6-like [Ostrinia furnacalis]
MSNFGILSTFDHNVQDWKTYKSRISQWFIANDIDAKNDTSGIKRRAILLSALADGTFKLAADLALPKELQDLPYGQIINLLDGHFTPKRCGFSERYKFYAATQQHGESHPQWAARLRGLTAHCGFKDVEEALRDRFVMGMVAGPEREKLFAQDMDGLSLAKAVELAESIHCARAGAASASAAPLQETVFKIVNSSSKPKNNVRSDVKCLVCGRSNHESSQCRFANYKCRKCNVKGHLRKMCTKVNFISTEDVSDDDDGKELFNIRSVTGEPMTEMVTINGMQLRFEIDSGSAVTVISEKMYNSHFKNQPLLPADEKLFTYTGNKMTCLGYVRLPVTYMQQTRILAIYVICNGGPPLLGRDFISSFKLELIPCNFVTNSSTVVQELQSQFPEVFSDSLGAFNKYKVKLQLKPDSKSFFFKARPVAFALRDKVDKELDRLVKLGILKPVEHSEYASPIVPVLKKNGSVRICADYSATINKQLLVEQYPLPTVSELFSKLHGGQQFSKLDLSMAYNQFLLDEESQNITCINTHRGLFNYTRLVFGLSSAPSIFQRAMENILAGLDGVLCLLDDVLVTDNCPELHLKKLHIVLKRLQDAGLTLQKEKCEFFKNEINYLGYIINRDGLKKDPRKVNAIADAPVPNNVNSLQSFLGMVNYYRNFVPNASSVLSPLYDLLKKGVKWHWSSVHDEAFKLIKIFLMSDQVLAHFDPQAKLILTVDASPNGLGAILSQIGSDGLERPISFASRTLNSAEKRYSQIQKEATAIVFGVRRYHQYLYGRSFPFLLRNDHKPLISIFGPHKGIPEVSANRLQRYAMFLSAYNYNIEYVRSADNSADYLSRASVPDARGAPHGEGGAHAAALVDRASYVNFIVEGNLPITLNELRKETKNDVTLCKVIDYVLKGWPRKMVDINVKPFHSCRLQLSYENGCLMRGHKVILPEVLRAKVLSELHSSHFGIVKTKCEARSRFWFPGIDNDIENMIDSCNICRQLRPTPAKAPLAPWQYPPKPFFRIHIDFLGPINNRMYLVIVDAYTKWVDIYDMTTSTTSRNVVKNMYDFMSKYGLPHTIVSDNGTAFTSSEFQTFCAINGIEHLTSPTYNPASNGQAESYVKIIKKGIKSCILSASHQYDLQLKMSKYLFDYRNSKHSVTGFSPAELVFGHKLRSLLDLLKPTPPSPSLTSSANNVQQNQCSQIKHYGGTNKYIYKVGDKVNYKKYSNNKKFEWCIGTVVRVIGSVLYLIRDDLTSVIMKKHKNQILPYKGEEGGKTLQQHWDYDDFLVEDNSSLTQNQPLGSSEQTTIPSYTRESGRLRNIPRVDYRAFF